LTRYSFTALIYNIHLPELCSCMQ